MAFDHEFALVAGVDQAPELAGCRVLFTANTGSILVKASRLDIWGKMLIRDATLRRDEEEKHSALETTPFSERARKVADILTKPTRLE